MSRVRPDRLVPKAIRALPESRAPRVRKDRLDLTGPRAQLDPPDPREIRDPQASLVQQDQTVPRVRLVRRVALA